MRQRLLLAALAPAMLLSAVPAGHAAPTPPAATSVVAIAGKAGDVAVVTFTTTVRLGNGGHDVTLDAPRADWSGVAIAPAGGSQRMDHYLGYRLSERMLCPGDRCPSPFHPTLGAPDDGKGYIVLQPGVYGIALLGPDGAAVRATVRLRGAPAGRLAPSVQRAPVYRGATFAPGDPVTRGFARVANPGRRAVLDSVAAAVTVPSGNGDGTLPGAAVADVDLCMTSGGRHDLDGTPGGNAPCQDVSGSDFTFEHTPSVVGERMATTTWYAGGYGFAGDSSGGGFEARVASAESRTVGIYVAVAMP